MYMAILSFTFFCLHAMDYIMDEERALPLHKLARPIMYLSEVPEETKKLGRLGQLEQAKKLCMHVDIYARDAIGKTALEHAKVTSPELFEYLSDVENKYWNAFEQLQSNRYSYISYLPKELITELGNYIRPIHTTVSIGYVLQRFAEPIPFDANSPEIKKIIARIRTDLDSDRVHDADYCYGPSIRELCRHYHAQTDIVPELINKGLALNRAFKAAVNHRNVPILEQICSLITSTRKIDFLNEPFSYALTPLAYAVTFKSLSLVQAFLRQGADVNSKDPITKQTPLHLSIYYEGRTTEYKKFLIEPIMLGIIKTLCNAGADLHAQDQRGDTPIELARKIMHPPVQVGYVPGFTSYFSSETFASVITLLEEEEKEKFSTVYENIQQHKKAKIDPNEYKK